MKFDKVCGVGVYESSNRYKAGSNSIHTKEYTTWHDMIRRCYDKKNHKKKPTYINCTVSDEWLYFQNFAEWFGKNYYELQNEKVQLDKDIICKSNKIYSPENCVFVPQSINLLMVKRDSTRGDHPIGVSWHKRDKKYRSNLNIDGRQKYLGYFDTEVEAFNAYKKAKEIEIIRKIKTYENKIPTKAYNKLYESLSKYKVDIKD